MSWQKQRAEIDLRMLNTTTVGAIGIYYEFVSARLRFPVNTRTIMASHVRQSSDSDDATNKSSVEKPITFDGERFNVHEGMLKLPSPAKLKRQKNM